jgi:hypothetical protein
MGWAKIALAPTPKLAKPPNFTAYMFIKLQGPDLKY